MTETFASAFYLWGKLLIFSFLCVCITKIDFKMTSGSLYREIKPLYGYPSQVHLMPSGISICNEPKYNEVLGINEQYFPPQ